MLSLLLLPTILNNSTGVTSINDLIPSGHIQITIEPGNRLLTDGRLVDWNTHAITISNKCLEGFQQPPSAYLMVLTNRTSVGLLLENLSCNHRRWWPGVRTVVVLKSLANGKLEGETFAKNVIESLWEKAVYDNAVYIEDDNVVFSADPFAFENRCGSEAIDINRWNCSEERCSYTPLHYPTTFKRCKIRVSGRDSFPFSLMVKGVYEGLDVELVKLMANRSNLEIEWTSRPSQQKASYSLAHAYYGNLSRNELDLAIGGSVVSITYFNNVTYAYSHATQYLYFYVPNGVELRGWKILYAMFPSAIWVYIVLTVVCSVVLLTTFGKRDTSEYFLVVLGLLLEETVRLPRGRLRIVAICLVFPFYYISSMYTTILHSYTMNPPTSLGINTLDELLDANMTVLLSDTNKFITDKVSSAKIKKILSKAYPSPGLEEGARLVHTYRQHVLAERDIEIDWVINSKGYAVHKIDYKVATIRNALVHPKGSKFSKRIYDLVLRVIEGGHWKQWMNELMRCNRNTKSSTLNKRPIALRDVDSAFTILLVGHLLAAVTLIIELFISKITKQKDDKYTVAMNKFY